LFGGATLFQLLGWSPTAGFNVTALFLPIILGFCYFAVADL
jgi:hypothetical protein